ncbi:DUF3426 domain-containing protein [Thermaurantiacus sp.]
MLGIGLGLSGGALTALMLRPEVVQALAADPRLPLRARQLAEQLAVVSLPSVSLPAFLRPNSPLRFEVASRLDRLPDGAAVLEVAGEIVNPGPTAAFLPAIELRLVDASGRMLERRHVRTSVSSIPAGGRIAFATVALHPPPGVASAQLAAGGALLDPL